MARFSEETLNQIKSGISLLEMVQGQGYKPTRQGKDYAIHCPFHEDKTASLVISPKSNLFNCFGCGAAGSVIDWVMQSQKLSFRQAVDMLCRDYPLLAANHKSTASPKPEIEQLPQGQDEQALLHQVVDYYHQTLLQSPEALAYLDKRGLGDAALIEQFKLGYANRTLAYRLPPKHQKAGKAMRGQLQQLGVLRESGHEHFNGSIVIPVSNPEGEILELYGRKVRDDLRKGTPRHLYLPGAHAGVWNLAGLAASAEVILCESLIDAMTFWCAGYKNVTASYGTSGFTADHLAAFKQLNVERVLIAYDRDEAGNAAAEKLAKTLQKQGFGCYRLLFPKGMDANQYATCMDAQVPRAQDAQERPLEVTPASKSLGVVIRSAEWVGEGEPPVIPQESKPVAAEIAQALPEPPAPEIEAEIIDDQVIFNFTDRRYRIRGLDKNNSYDVLKVNVLASNAAGMHVDSFDLYSAKHRQSFIKLAALELGANNDLIKTDLGKVLLKLEQLQDQLIQAKTVKAEDKTTALTEEENQQALELLQSPNLLDRVLSDFSRCGVVGEESNKLVGYLAASSRKLERPLAIIIQSTSAAGKSSLMDAILNMMPEAERMQYSAMTGQSLFYMGETNLKHKILAIAEEEGASNASYALKLLQSEGEITIASTGKDADSGDLVTKEYTVQGPVMLFLTTTAIDIDEELLNRCLVLTVNESREQTRAIHEAQRRRRTLAGLEAKIEKERLVKLHRNAQSLLKSLRVINPYADQLTFLDDKTRTRRDHEKYLTLIDSIALLHQYQRDIKTLNSQGETIDYIEVQLSDIEIANQLAHEVLGRTLDELPPQTRKLLKLIQTMVAEQCKAEDIEQRDYRFSRKTVRDYTGWGDTQLKVHLSRLEGMEYLLIHSSQRGKAFAYELLYDAGDLDQAHHLMGLINPQNIHYDKEKSGVGKVKAGLGRPSVGGWSGTEKQLKPSNGKSLKPSSPKNEKPTSNRDSTGSCRSADITPLAAQVQ